MSGSGTILRANVESGNTCRGFDLDPLAVLMARVWTCTLADGLVHEATRVVEAAKVKRDPRPPWGNCAQTQGFAEFWFEERQRNDLSALAQVLAGHEGTHRDALMLALSRLIITKEKGSSIARFFVGHESILGERSAGCMSESIANDGLHESGGGRASVFGGKGRQGVIRNRVDMVGASTLLGIACRNSRPVSADRPGRLGPWRLRS